MIGTVKLVSKSFLALILLSQCGAKGTEPPSRTSGKDSGTTSTDDQKNNVGRIENSPVDKAILKSSRTDSVVAPSLFSANEKMMINPLHLKQYSEVGMGLTETVAPKIHSNLELAFILNESNCSNIPPYFGNLLSQKLLSKSKNPSVASGFLSTAVSVDAFKTDIAKITCIVGVSTNEGVVISESSNDPRASSQNYIDQLQLGSEQKFWDDSTQGQKVKVAVIDTGFDLRNEDLPSISSNLNGTDIFNVDNVPQDDRGHGTAVASIIGAKRGNSIGIRGLSSDIVEILPVKVASENGVASSDDVANGILLAINYGAEVINLSLGGRTSGCDVILGYAIEYGIKRNVFFTIAAGNQSSLIIPARRDSVVSFEPTITPSCWGLYFKGAITVAAGNTDYSNLRPTSNFGSAVELLAPGENILTYSLANQLTSFSGTSFSAPMVASAAALTIAVHKKNAWKFDPWLIEDLLLNGSQENKNIVDKVYKGKFLNLASLANYLKEIAKRPETERSKEPYNDPTLGDGYRYTADGTSKMMRLEVLTTTKLINSAERAAVRARAYYDNGSYFVVTDKVRWTSSNSTLLPISQNGVVEPQPDAVGKTFTVSAEYLGFVSAISINVNSISDLIGDYSQVQSLALSIIGKRHNQIQVKAEMHFNDGTIRDFTNKVTWSSSNLSILRHRGEWNTSQNKWALEAGPDGSVFGINPNAVAGSTHTITASYRGVDASVIYTIEQIDFDYGFASIVTEGTGGGAWNIDGQFGKEAVTFNIVKDINYRLNGNVRYTRGFHTNPLGYHPGTWSTTARGISFQKFPASATNSAGQSVSSDIVNLLVSSDTVPGRYSARFISDLIYPASRNRRFTVNIIFDVKEAQIESVRIAGNPVTHWGGISSSYRLLGRYTNNLEVTLQNDQVQWEIGSENGGSLTKSGPKFQNQEQVAFYIFDGNPGAKFQIKGIHNETRSEATKILTAAGMNSFNFQRVANIPRAPSEPTPKGVSSFCTNARKAASPFAGGSGTSASPFKICTNQQFKAIRSLTQSNCSNCSSSLHFELASDLDFRLSSSSERFEPISVFLSSSFDGNGFEIQNLTIDESETGQRSIFQGNTWQQFKNLGIRNVSVRGDNIVAALIGTSMSLHTIDNVYLLGGNVIGNSYVGGLIGFHPWDTNLKVTNIRVFRTSIAGENSAGSIVGFHATTNSLFKNIFSSAEISNPRIAGLYIGGLFGSFMSSRISDNLNLYTVDLSQPEQLIGAKLIDANFSGRLTQIVAGTSDNVSFGVVGGIVGMNNGGILFDVENNSAITTGGETAGGIVGLNLGVARGYWGTIFRATNKGTITGGRGLLGYSHVGGITGQNLYGALIKVNNSGSLIGVKGVGGIVGNLKEWMLLSQSSSSGRMVSENGNLGKIAGTFSRLPTSRTTWLDYAVDTYTSSNSNANIIGGFN